MAISDMVVYNQEMNTSILETIPQFMDVVNANSRGTIQMVMDGFEGDFMKNAIYASFAGDVYDVDRYAANGVNAGTAITQIEEIGVKVAGGIKKFFEPAQFTWMEKNVAEGIEVASRGIAEAIFQYELNNSIAAVVSAIENNADATYSIYATKSISQVTLNSSHAKFGDNSQILVAQIMHSSTYHRLINTSLANAAQLYTAGTVTILDILGKAIIVTDCPALITTVGTYERVISLAQGGLVISNVGDQVVTINSDTTKDRAETVMMNDFTYGVACKGYQWDIANGGKSPTSAELATGSNWNQYVTDVKHTAGVIAIGNYTLAAE
jgi:hypothetical protein